MPAEILNSESPYQTPDALSTTHCRDSRLGSTTGRLQAARSSIPPSTGAFRNTRRMLLLSRSTAASQGCREPEGPFRIVH